MVVSGVRERSLVAKWFDSRARKVMKLYSTIPVPQTDTGGWEEYSKANGLRVVKELGKITL